MIEGQKSFTPAGIARAASLPIVGFWVLDAWRSIPAEMVAFKKCGMVLIPSCITKVCKQSYFNNCAVKVHVCVRIALIKRKMVESCQQNYNVLLKLFNCVGISKYYYVATCDHLFF